MKLWNKVKTIQIDIHEFKEENVEGMFSNIREYFDGKWQPKVGNSDSILAPPSSVVSSSFAYSDNEEK